MFVSLPLNHVWAKFHIKKVSRTFDTLNFIATTSKVSSQVASGVKGTHFGHTVDFSRIQK